MIKLLNRAGMDWTDRAVRPLKSGPVERQPESPEPVISHFRGTLIVRLVWCTICRGLGRPDLWLDRGTPAEEQANEKRRFQNQKPR